MGLFGSKTLPSCSFPEHHGSGDGMGGGVIVLAVCASFAFMAVFAFALRLIAIGLVVASFALMGGTVWILLRALHRRTLVSYSRPAVPPLRPREPFPQRQQRPEVVEQHLHVYLAGMTPAERAETIRQIRGGRP
jgi:hypothetical protein